MPCLPPEDNLAGQEWLALAEVGGKTGESADHIYSATALNPAMFQEILSPLLQQAEVVEWDKKHNQFVAERRSTVGHIILSREPLSDVPEQARNEALFEVVRKQGLSLLPWNKKLEQWRGRVMLLRAADLGTLESPEEEVGPRPGCPSQPVAGSFQRQPAGQSGRLVGPLPGIGQAIGRFPETRPEINSTQYVALALCHWIWSAWLPNNWLCQRVPASSIDYNQYPPVLAVKLQEMFGCEETPSIADGRVPLLIHLLSPAGRPLQITQDLAGFWRSGYQDVKREMKGRYPKHPWPDDPLQASATRYTKRREKQAWPEA